MSKQLFAKEYEDFLLTGKEDTINSLPSGSEEKKYFLLIRQLLKEDLTPELEKKIEEATLSNSKKQSARLKALYIYKKLKKYPDKKEEVIQDIKNLFDIGGVTQHSKPVKYNKTKKTGMEVEENEEQKLPHELKLEKYILTDKFVEDVYKGKIVPNNNELKKYFKNNTPNFKLDFNKIPKDTLAKILTIGKDFSGIIHSVLQSFKTAKFSIFQDVIKFTIDQIKKDDKKKEDFENFFKRNENLLLTEQIEHLLTLNASFDFEQLIPEIIARKYPKPIQDKKERVKILKEIKTLLNNYKYKYSKIARNVLLSILELNSDLNIYEFDTFLEYVELPMWDVSYMYNISKKNKEQIRLNSRQRDLYVQVIPIDRNKEVKLIEKYLKHFFLKEKMDFKKLNKYFNEGYIKKFYSRMKFYSGDEEPMKDKILSPQEISDLMKEIKLTICDYNKEKFNINEDIELSLEIKNIQTLFVNIYEINTENYYYTNKNTFDSSISLDGIVPTFEDKYTYNEKPQLLLEKKISLQKIPKKRGLFVVEFIGNGHVSRAVIQRGDLKCIHKNTVNGKVFYILDEENKILKGEKTGLWLNNIWYPSIKDTGAILIPYSVKGNIFILKHDDFCSLEKGINIPEELYEFKGQFIINEESFIMGNVAKILVRPYLFVCDEICPLDNLKNVKLTIVTIKTENNQVIPSTNVIDNVQLSYDKEFSFEFQVPPKLRSIQFILSGEIQYKTRDEKSVLSFSNTYTFSHEKDYDLLIKKNEKGNYIFNLLGRNGEPKPNHQISLKLTHNTQPEINKNNSILLESDVEGKIDLGKLTNIDSFTIDSKPFLLEKLPKHTYLSNLIILEDQIITLPFISKENDKINLTKLSNGKISENLNDLLKIEITDKVHNLGKITLSKLPLGEYQLDINGTIISIKVVKGKVMDVNDFVVLDNGNIKYNNNLESPISIENMTYENKELKIKLNKNNKSLNNPRVHINCVQYLSERSNKNLEGFLSSKFFEYRINNQFREFQFAESKNKYLNNKILSDELQYVLDRKQYQINLGNSLENPSLLLKPQFIRDTTTELQKGKEGEAFDRYAEPECAKCCMDTCRTMARGMMNVNNIKLHDFINQSPFVAENLVPNENGEIIIKDLDLNEYSFMHILCFDNISCNEDWFCLKNGKTSLRDLRAVNEFDLNKNYCEFRKLYPLAKKAKHHINDITSIKYKIFDSLEKYLEFIKIVNPDLNNNIKEFEFLLNFENLKLPEKLEKLTQYFSHEVNIYLYFHHNDFFNKYVFPIIKYKSEKTFIDYFLINDIDKIKEYSKPQNIIQLNVFEKCLLIYSIRKENKELAHSIARQIRAECPKENQRELKRLFNIALNLKSIEEEKIQENMEFEAKSVRRLEKNAMMERAIRPMAAPPMMMCCKMMAAPRMDRMKFKKMARRDMEEEDDMFDVDDESAKIINSKAQIFKEEGKSKEYCETHYYNQVYKNNDYRNRISYNHFFADLAQFWSQNDSERNKGFKSDNILIKPNNITELLFMLSVLDLEEKTIPKSQNLIKDKGLGLTIETNTNAYLLTKEINETQLNTDNKYALILAQMVFEEDKINNDDNEEKEPIKFLTNRTYIQKTIVTNISSENINCEILMQIPEGSIPVDSDEYKIIETANISSYKSEIFEQKFYFPQEGMFKQYPASASINDLVIAKGGLKTFEVVASIELSKDEIVSIDDVLNQGNKKQILEFINKKDVIKNDELRKIYWMLKDKDFYNKLISILKTKYIFDWNIWEYSSEYADINSLQEFILNSKNKDILKSIGHEFDLLFLKLDKTNNAHILNHLDYYPILKNRIFKLPKSKSILTTQLRDTYEDYVSYLITLEKINDYEYMRLCYYLILQQRIKEATIIYNKIDKKNIVGDKLSSLELQYDYLTAYLDFSNGYPKFEKAREIVKKYKDIAISNWKNMFNEIEDQLNEYDGKVNFDEEINKEQDELSKKDKFKAESEEALNIEIKDQIINIIYKNISEIKVKYYLIDIEILFSRSPFVKKTKVDFGFIKPQKVDIIKLEKKHNENKYILNIPEELKNKNFYIEISSGKIKENEIYYSSLLKYSVIESIGEIKVMSPELKPLPKVYVKCFCETNSGQIKFYKDGFTDLRGKFDYISLNTDLINDVNKFSMLMVSKEFGSIIVSCNPPKMIKDGSEKDSVQKIFDYRQQARNKFRK